MSDEKSFSVCQEMLPLFRAVLKFCSTNRLFKIQERALIITDKDTESTFSELLQKDCAVTIHTKNLQILMDEMYKTRNKLNPLFMQDIFRKNKNSLQFAR